MKLESKVLIYGFSMQEIVFLLIFFILGFVISIVSAPKIGMYWAFGILLCFIGAPVTFIKVFIHSKNDGYFTNLIQYLFKPKFYLPERNIDNKRRF